MRVVQRFPIKGDSSEIAQKHLLAWDAGMDQGIWHMCFIRYQRNVITPSFRVPVFLRQRSHQKPWETGTYIFYLTAWAFILLDFFFFSYISSVAKKREKDFSKVVIYDFPFSDHDLNGVLKNLSLSVTFLLSAPLNSPESYQITILVSTITATIVKSYWHSSSQGMKFSFHFIKIKQVVAWLIVMSQHVLND